MPELEPYEVDAHKVDAHKVDKTRPSRPKRKLTWMKLWSIGHHNLRLSADEWLDMTPRMAQELERRYLEEMQQVEMVGAITSSTVANFSERAPKSPIPVEKFLIHTVRKDNEDDGTSGGDGERMSGDDIMAVMGQYRKQTQEQEERAARTHGMRMKGQPES
jgi:hypothetical protein